MANDSKETIIGGDGGVWVGDVGTSEPTNESTAPAPGLTNLGYHSEDGLSFNKSLEVIRHRAWQARFEIRRQRGNEDLTLTFSLLQWNVDSLPFALGGGEVSEVSTGHYRYDPPDVEDELDERMLIADVRDGTGVLRIVIPKGSVTEGVESTFSEESMGMLPVSFQALQPDDGGPAWYILTNVPGFGQGS